MGKSRLLDEIVILCQNLHANLHMVHIMSSFDIMKDTFKMIRIVIEDLLGIIDSEERQPGSFAHIELYDALKERFKIFLFFLNHQGSAMLLLDFFRCNSIYKLTRDAAHPSLQEWANGSSGCVAPTFTIVNGVKFVNAESF